MFPLIRESEGAHAGLGEASTAPPGVADGEAHAAVAQPPAVAAVVLLEAPRCVQLTHQCQPGPLVSAGILRLLEGEGSREEGDGSWGRESGEGPSAADRRDSGSEGGDLTWAPRGEAEGIEAVLLVFGTVAAEAGDRFRTAGGPRVDDGVLDRPVSEPAGVAPVQTLRPGCRRDAGQRFQHLLPFQNPSVDVCLRLDLLRFSLRFRLLSRRRGSKLAQGTTQSISMLTAHQASEATS